MKGKNLVFIITLLSILSCNNERKQTYDDAKVDSDRKEIEIPQIAKTGKAYPDSSKSIKNSKDISQNIYSISIDTICQSVKIGIVKMNKSLDIPEEIYFSLVFRDRRLNQNEKIFEGIARLASSEESFSDNSDIDEGDYFAADYTFEAKNYSVSIKLDIQSYEACIATVITSQPDKVLGVYGNFFKVPPEDRVMKKGDCK